MAARFRKIGVTTLGACAGAAVAAWALNPFDKSFSVSFYFFGIRKRLLKLKLFFFRQHVNAASIATPRVKRKLPPRSEQVKTLQSGEEYDVIIIGGGATGAGVALDSITRGNYKLLHPI